MKRVNDGSSFGSAVALIAVLAGAALGGYGVFVGLGEMFGDDEIATWVKVIVSIVVGAVIIALINVVWNRIKESQDENLGDVEL